MTLRDWVAVAMAIALPGCNLLVDTSDFRDQPVDALPPPPLEVRGNILELTFNDGSAQDSSSLMNPVSAANGAAATSEGKYGGAFAFAGQAKSLDRLDLGDNDDLSLGNLVTIEMWLKRSVTSPGGLESLYGDRSGAPLSQEYWLYLDSDIVKFRTNHLGDEHIVSMTDLELPRDVWVHLAITWDGSTLSLFRDGTLHHEQPDFTHQPEPLPHVILIGSATGSASFHGVMDEIKVSNYAKSPAELEASMMFDSAAAGL